MDPSKLDRTTLVLMTNDIIESLTTEEMISRMLEFKSLESGRTREESSRILSVDDLVASGAHLPRNFRLTSRYFEEEPRFSDRFDFGRETPSAWESITAADPDFAERMRVDYPSAYEMLVDPEFTTTGYDPRVATSACGGIGGTIAGTGGCACGGASDD